MKNLLSIIGIVFSVSAHSQCFQIESILVDGCDGGNEGKNEMVRFKVGSVPLSVTTLSVNWPSNSWLGVCQSVSTATSVTLMNSTILGCGLLKEPIGGILPANSKVLLVTSTDFNPLAQSFVNLTDTLIIIFQCAGNTGGHFANYSLTGTFFRTLSMSFSAPVGCKDSVTYNKTLLLKQDLTIGAQDGGAVEFDAIGNATYVNRGCSGPFIPLSVDAGLNKTICFSATQSLTAIASGPFSSINWSLGSTAYGTFAPSNSLTTIYTPGLGDNGTIKLFCTVIKICGTKTITTKDSVYITILIPPIPVITANTNSICPNETATLTVVGGLEPYTWSNSINTGSTVTTNGGTVSVSYSNSCGSATQSINITVVPINASLSANPMIGSKPLNVNFINNSIGASSYLWNFGNSMIATTQTVTSQTYTAAGNYMIYLYASNGTCTSIDSVIITVLEDPPYLVIPNVFTPNGDGINELFKIKGFNIIEFNCVIFNRWGIKLFEWNDLKTGWDGKIEDKDAVDGIYFFIIHAKGITSKDIKTQGTFSLIR